MLNNTGIITKATDAKNSSERWQAQEEVNLAISYLQIENATSTLTRENKRIILEDELRKISADSSVSISGTGYKITHKKYDFFVNKDLKISSSGKTFDAVEWDKTAASEDLFIWKSNDPNNSEYGTVIGYTENLDNYPVLRYPSRCTKIGVDIYSGEYTFYKNDSEGKIFLGSRDITANIEKIELPSTVTEIGEYAFNGGSTLGYNFENLKEISIPDSVTTIGSWAFAYCDSLKDITIPNNVTNIGTDAFRMCTGLTKITIPNSVTNIEDFAFAYCDNLKNITIPNSVTTIGRCAFDRCTGLTDVKIPDSVTNIGDEAFNGCTGLTKITIPNSVTTIGRYAFRDCTGLTDVKIPNGVTNIGTDAFRNVAHITYAGNATGSPWGAKSIGNN